MKSQHFQIHELIPEHIFDKYGEKAWRFIDRDLIITLDDIKNRFPEGTITINNYYWGGRFNWSGLRTPDSEHYSETSMHSLGKAVDLKFSAYTPDEVRKYIIHNEAEFPFIRGLELETPTWVHVDVRQEDYLVVFKP